MNLFLGIDLGTSGCRGIVIDSNHQIQAQANTSIPAPVQRGSTIEQDPVLWWDSVCRVLHSLQSKISMQNIRAIAVDGTSGTLLTVDEYGTPLNAALMYNDIRSIEEASLIKKWAPPQSGAHGASSSLAKFLWMQRNNRLNNVRRVLHQADWIAGKLIGVFKFSDENSALKLGFDPLTGAWPDWLNQLNINRKLLPEIVPRGTNVKVVSRKAINRFGFNDETQVVAGTTDSIAATLATDAHCIGDAVTSLGSTLVLKVFTQTPISAPEYGVYSHRMGHLWLAGGASNSGGAVLKKYFTIDQLNKMTQKVRPEKPTHLNYYPLPCDGERFPVNDPDKKPKLLPRPESDTLFFQGILEGIAQIEKRGYELLAELGAPYPTSIKTTGGGASNPAWRQIRSHMLGVPVLEATQNEAAYGAALLALRATSQK
ncbi:MAG: FGGY-family carbohydrate kinase [Gammaproteobacteria bacterium]|nr:FGGY-family carbohydrate kinase [Gammaproteobacteria bacterium]